MKVAIVIFLLVVLVAPACQASSPDLPSVIPPAVVNPAPADNSAPAQETKPTRAERAQAFRQILLADKASVEKLHKAGVQISYLASLNWKVYPNECQQIILISSSHQRLIKFVDGLPKYVFVCSTRSPHHGKEHFGFYKVEFKKWNYRSKKYGVRMPWAMEFDVKEGVFIHETKLVRQLGRRASHGCIRLNGPNAKTLYHDTPDGTPVAYLK